MATVARHNIDYRLLEAVSDLILCSRCLRTGRVTRIRQLISAQHKPRNVCRECRAAGRDAT